jgi:hypothetical protein
MKVKIIKFRENIPFIHWKPGDKILCTDTHGAGFHQPNWNPKDPNYAFYGRFYEEGQIYTIDDRDHKGIWDHGHTDYNKYIVYIEEMGMFSNHIDKFIFHERNGQTRDTK